ncbi:MAG TPA: hypothetical protein VKO84_01095 [Gaiellaceae bacterium]|nr:hypothetical protein [Gaiellaceae bacterium]
MRDGARMSRGLLLLEPSRCSWIAARPNAHWYAVAAVCVGALTGQLDANIVMLAFPTLTRDPPLSEP